MYQFDDVKRSRRFNEKRRTESRRSAKKMEMSIRTGSTMDPTIQDLGMGFPQMSCREPRKFSIK